MARRAVLAGLLVLSMGTGLVRGQGHHGGFHHYNPVHFANYGPHHSRGSGGFFGGAAGWYPFAPYYVIGSGGWFSPLVGPPLVTGPVPFLPGAVMASRGPLINPVVPVSLPNPARERAKQPDPARASQFLTLGDRLFRHGNFKKAEERYKQAQEAQPDAAASRVRLAQIALVRGKYSEAAELFREAQAVEPGWLVNAPDIQAIYAEPGDFAAPLNKLEAHLQAHPGDRDAWFVLGAQYFLSGRTRQASDIFVRLSDRRADPTLAAFRDASTPDEPARR
jgi:hypothetical protein